jgi:hypothetical protein
MAAAMSDEPVSDAPDNNEVVMIGGVPTLHGVPIKPAAPPNGAPATPPATLQKEPNRTPAATRRRRTAYAAPSGSTPTRSKPSAAPAS